ncbi:hypothetical protein C8J57DRAFT_206919 [Mycena rebaudengoi]|nr:hypothetical protein C8J57DRAFT_206919 [Mycena rebaudengoi]
MSSFDGPFAGFAAAFSPSTSASAFPHSASAFTLAPSPPPHPHSGSPPLQTHHPPPLYPALSASPPADDTACRMCLEAARAYGHDDTVRRRVIWVLNDDSVALDHTFPLDHTGAHFDAAGMGVGADDDAPLPGAFEAPTTPPANKFDFVFSSGGATAFRFAGPACAANSGNGAGW